MINEYDQNAVLVIDALMRKRVVSLQEKEKINNHVKQWKESGYWDTLDCLYVFDDPHIANINWKKP